MILQAILFYIFAAAAVAAGVMVVAARNPVHSVLFLILAFFNTAGLFVLIGAEFLAMILVIVYVGAVAVLFLFVVMMLDIDFAEMRSGFVRYLPIGAAGRADAAWPSWCWSSAQLGADRRRRRSTDGAPINGGRRAQQYARRSATSSTPATLFAFQGAGLILLVAMIGAIVLDPAPSRRGAPPVDRGPARAAPARNRSRWSRCRSARGC